MAKSKALLEAEETNLKLNSHIAHLHGTIAHLHGTIERLRGEVSELRSKGDCSGAQDREIAPFVKQLDRMTKRCDDLRSHSHHMSMAYVEAALVLTGLVVEVSKILNDGPFKCAGLTDYDPEHIFEFFAKKIPGGDHWCPEQSEESAKPETGGE